ncbi:ABC transporter, permease protein [hydrothermal vent metagenome]|uniref:ABC transporter, permease protein n=1 Tax=hydrothermal vent metagenome TaxID=652676 RepID=A0A3B0VRL9_9ZZZZ
MKQNKLRSFITAFNVAWGIFILIILMGFGSGFQHGVEFQFNDDATNSMWLRAGETSKPYKGIKPGKRIQFTNQDYEAIKKIEGIEYITGRYYVLGEFTVRYKDNLSFFNVHSCHPDHKYIEKTLVTSGRYLNDSDIKEKRKVTVIGQKVVEVLFGRVNPIGKYIDVNGIQYKVVGTFKDEGNEFEQKVIYIPISTAQIAYGGGNEIHNLIVTVANATEAESKMLESKIMTYLSGKHNFDPTDKKAVRIFNGVENFMRFMNLFTGIRFFLFIVGAFTLIAGVVGVSNIMLIVVKERTKEVGVRKALGATPNSIIGLFLQESMFITLTAGYVGMVAGFIFIDSGSLSAMMESFSFPMDFFKNPEVSISGAITATLVLAVFGSLAGYFPARKAAKVEPIEALKDE